MKIILTLDRIKAKEIIDFVMLKLTKLIISFKNISNMKKQNNY